MKKLPIILTATAVILGSSGYVLAKSAGDARSPGKKINKKISKVVHKPARHSRTKARIKKS
jgi:hypothetical protein